MRFLVDAQLPARLARLLGERGHDALHTSELPEGNRTSDARLASLADESDRVVVTKDRDFRDSHILTGSPRRLLVVRTGNITNNALLALVSEHLATLIAAFHDADFVELSHREIVIHERLED